MIGWQNRKLFKMSSGGGGSQLPSLEERKAEFQWQQQQARDDQAFARSMAMEEREWAENMASAKALRASKEEAARLASMQAEQEQVADEAEAQMDAIGSDIDQNYSGSNMWANLIHGAGTES
jgi:hypothetical protein